MNSNITFKIAKFIYGGIIWQRRLQKAESGSQEMAFVVLA